MSTAPGVRRVEVVAALSLAVDIGMGQPLEQGLRTCVIATRLAEHAGLPAADRPAVHHLALLRHVGCTAESDQASAFLGDEIAFRSGAMGLNWSDQVAVFRYMIRNVGRGESAWQRTRRVGNMLAHGKDFMSSAESVCEAAELLSQRMGFDDRTQKSLWQVFEAWDGKGGIPGRVKGEEIDVAARTVRIAEAAEVHLWLHGFDAALDAVQRGAGRAYDPNLAACFADHAAAILDGLDAESVWDDVIAADAAADTAADPSPAAVLTDDELDEACRAIADFADQKSQYTFGHSRAVADLAEAAGRHLRLPAADVVSLRRAGLVHDLGRVGVSASVWGKPGPLTRDEWEKVRLHAYHTERSLSRPPLLAQLGALASTHHERLDGSGYHRSSDHNALPVAARVLAAADCFQAMTEARPHRPAATKEAAADHLRAEVRAGRLDGDAVDAVLSAAGQTATGAGARRRQRERPGGLTDREVDVLRVLAEGRSIKQIAEVLHVAPKTVDAHIQHIYSKLGVSTRAGAALFGLQHGLVGATS